LATPATQIPADPNQAVQPPAAPVPQAEPPQLPPATQ
jgi:hypothetical protein